MNLTLLAEKSFLCRAAIFWSKREQPASGCTSTPPRGDDGRGEKRLLGSPCRHGCSLAPTRSSNEAGGLTVIANAPCGIRDTERHLRPTEARLIAQLKPRGLDERSERGRSGHS